MGFSMGGAVSVRAAAHPAVVGVLGLAPWLPDELDLAPLRGRGLDVLHGALDRWLPGIPGVSPALSRRGYERARALGVDGSYTLIPRAVHAVALRSPSGRLVPLPRAASWSELAAARIFDFRRSAGRGVGTEGEGFEPSKACTLNGFRDRPVRPLRHPSEPRKVSAPSTPRSALLGTTGQSAPRRRSAPM